MSQQNPIRFKIIMLGEDNVGKSAIMSRYAKGEFQQNSPPTLGIDFVNKLLNVGNLYVRVSIWDTPGIYSFRRVLREHYYKVEQYQFTIQAIENPLRSQKSSGSMKSRPMEGTFHYYKSRVSLDEGLAFALDNGMYFIETSSITGQNINEAFEEFLMNIVEIPTGLGTYSSFVSIQEQQLSWCQRLHRFFFS